MVKMKDDGRAVVMVGGVPLNIKNCFAVFFVILNLLSTFSSVFDTRQNICRVPEKKYSAKN
jgi:hypothetical protein